MTLWLAVHLPLLALEAVLSQENVHQACVLVALEKSDQRVLMCNAAADARGVRVGMRLAAANALSADLRCLGCQPHVVRDTLQQLASWAQQFTPLVSLVDERGLQLEVQASLALFGGIDALMERIREDLTRLHFTVSLGVAPTPSGAWLLAREGRQRKILERADLLSILSTASLSWLDIGPSVVAELHDMGLRTLGDCLQLPRAGLALRFGYALLDHLDQAFGDRPQPLKSFVLPEHFQTEVELTGLVHSTQPVLFVLQRMLSGLRGFLLAKGLGATQLQLELRGPSKQSTTLKLQLLQPSRDVNHILKLWQEHLDRLDLKHPIEGLELRALESQSLRSQTLDILSPSSASSIPLSQLLDRLQGRLGPDKIQWWTCFPSHCPERATVALPTSSTSARKIEIPPFRPVWLLAKPRRLPSGKEGPSWRGALQLLHGPERIESGWWDGLDIQRDYFLAHTEEQQTLWIYRELTPREPWYLHGIFA